MAPDEKAAEQRRYDLLSSMEQASVRRFVQSILDDCNVDGYTLVLGALDSQRASDINAAKREVGLKLRERLQGARGSQEEGLYLLMVEEACRAAREPR